MAFFALKNQFVLSSLLSTYVDSKGLIEFVPSILVSFSVFDASSRTAGSISNSLPALACKLSHVTTVIGYHDSCPVSRAKCKAKCEGPMGRWHTGPDKNPRGICGTRRYSGLRPAQPSPEAGVTERLGLLASAGQRAAIAFRLGQLARSQHPGPRRTYPPCPCTSPL